jgi:hypothetical protein
MSLGGRCRLTLDAPRGPARRALSVCGCHPVLVRPDQFHEPDPRRIRTLCPICQGDGAVAHPRAMILIRYGQVRGYEVKPCALCAGWEWLPGLVAPA